MPLKSREYQDRIKSIGFERGTAWAVSELIERFNGLERDLKECGEQLLAMITVLDKITTGAGMLRQKIEELDRRSRVDETHPTPNDGLN
jgi:hypothetical protein